MLDLKPSLDGFFHSLIPKQLRETLVVHSPEYIKVRALSVLLFCFVLFQAIEIIFVSSWHVLHHQNLLKHELFSIGVFFIFALQSVLFYRFGNAWLSALAFTSIYFLIVVIIIVMSGGYQSPMKILLLTCPFMAFVVGDKQEGVQTSFLVVLIGILLAFLDYIDFTTPNLFAEANPTFIFAIDMVITLTVTLLALTVYETALRKKEESGIKASSFPTALDTDAALDLADKIIFRLVPPSVSASMPMNRVTYIRVRFLSVMLFTIVAAGALTTFPLIASFWIVDANPSASLVKNIIMLAILLFFVLQLWLFNRFGNYDLSSVIFTNSYFLGVAVMVLSSGGYDSPLKYSLITAPIIAFVIGGVRAGIQNGIYTAIIGIALSVYKNIGFEFEDIFIGNISDYLAFGANWTVTLSIIMVSIFIYETELQHSDKK